MKTTFTLGVGIAAIVASVVIIAPYFSITNLPAPLYISHSPRPTVTLSLSPIATPTPVASTSQGPSFTQTPAPTIIPGARPTDWKTYKNYEWQFEIKLPPNWTVDDKYGIVISGDNSAIRIDTDGVGPDGPGSPTITTRTVAGQEVEVADGTFFSLKRNNRDFPYYFFRINNWTPTVDKILSTFIPAATPAPTPTATVIPVHVPAGWKTYRVDTYNYQISYPPAFFLNGGGNELSIGSVDPTTYQHPGIDQSNIGIGVLLYPDQSSLAVWREGFSFVESATTTVAGETAIRGKTKDDQLPYFSGDIIMIHNGKGYQITYYPYDSKYVPVFEQMLKTFRFTK